MRTEDIKRLAEAWQEVVSEKKLDPVDDKENDKKFKDRKDKDIDNDGDVDDSDEYLHKRRAATDDAIDARDGKKDDDEGDEKEDPKKKKKVAGNDGEKTAEISKIGEKKHTVKKEDVDVLIDALEEASKKDQTKGATEPEGIMDKESPKSKEFADKHKVDVKKHDDLEKIVPNPKVKVKEDNRSYQQKIMDILNGKSWSEIAQEVDQVED
jgi:hypothetical protein